MPARRPPSRPRHVCLAPTAAPEAALRVWTIPDAKARAAMILCQLPDGTILRYPATGPGVTKLLSLIIGRGFDFGGAPVPSFEPAPTIQHAHAESVLRKRGVIR